LAVLRELPLRVEVITVTPEAVSAVLGASILGRAAAAGAVAYTVTDLRDFGVGRWRRLDDAPYGGGAGMVLAPGPVVAAIEAARARVEPGRRAKVVLLSPAGRPFDQATARRLAGTVDDLILFCGRYEGHDARIEGWVDEELSLGDFVLTGGEIAALAVTDAVVRLLPGALGNAGSAAEESFESGLLEHRQFTRPPEFRGEQVPAVLLSGDHAAVARFRRADALERTRKRRPDLLRRAAVGGNRRLDLDDGAAEE
jgi:tRNA (guanine37-N1)-methyltransferase